MEAWFTLLSTTYKICFPNDSVKMAATEAEKNRVIVNGIKGRSVLTVIDLVGGPLLTTCIVYLMG